MLRRTIFWSLTVTSAAISFVSDFGGAIVMGSSKDQIVKAYEQAGVDVSACKGHGRGIANPSIDMTACLERSLRDTASKLEHAGADPGAADAVGEPDLE